MPHKYGKKAGMSKKSYETAMKKEMKKPNASAMRAGSVRAGMDMKKMKK